MKKIEAVIPPFKLSDVKEALQRSDIHDFTIIEMKEFTVDTKHQQLYRGAEVCVEFRIAIKVEAICPTFSVPAIKDAIIKAAYTGRTYDGILTVSDVERVLQL